MKETEKVKSWWSDYGQLCSIIGVMLAGITFIKLLLNDQNHRIDRVEDRVISIERFVHEVDKKVAVLEDKK